jgi:hypothetical protein
MNNLYQIIEQLRLMGDDMRELANTPLERAKQEIALQVSSAHKSHQRAIQNHIGGMRVHYLNEWSAK